MCKYSDYNIFPDDNLFDIELFVDNIVCMDPGSRSDERIINTIKKILFRILLLYLRKPPTKNKNKIRIRSFPDF